MNVLSCLRDLYKGKNNLIMQVIIFSVSGIIAIGLNNCAGAVCGTFYESYLGYAPINNIELCVDFLAALMLIFLMISYGFIYTSRMLNTAGSYKLPHISLTSFIILLRIFPIILSWLIYFGAAFFIGSFIFNAWSFVVYTCFLSVLFCIFMWIILILFSKDFQYKKLYFMPSTFFTIFKQYGLKAFSVFGDTILLAIFFAVVIYCIFVLADKFNSQLVQLGVRLLGLCFFVYFINILNLTALRNFIVKVIKE